GSAAGAASETASTASASASWVPTRQPATASGVWASAQSPPRWSAAAASTEHARPRRRRAARAAAARRRAIAGSARQSVLAARARRRPSESSGTERRRSEREGIVRDRLRLDRGGRERQGLPPITSAYPNEIPYLKGNATSAVRPGQGHPWRRGQSAYPSASSLWRCSPSSRRPSAPLHDRQPRRFARQRHRSTRSSGKWLKRVAD